MKLVITIVKTFSPQAIELYKALGDGRPKSVKELADEVGILPNGAYRHLDKLMHAGVIEVTPSYPAAYKKNSSRAALNLFLNSAAYSFKKDLGIEEVEVKKNSAPKITVLKDREQLIKRSLLDFKETDKTFDHIVSGFMLPDFMFLEYKRAIARSVKIRTIVQVSAEINGKKLEPWKELGVEVKYLPDLDIRLLNYDKKITYLTTQDPENQSSGFGVRFEYKPLAIQMAELFEQNWQKAEPL